ncbi:uncharacterized protein I303_102528 [Kwoniella dejecticola CBS 10117]|uniref:Uncharacterized protein n=1 Tax=Kwoniella dejecticola CBS 10117 TaxID=1296121 RepID=A0A1A6A901_9TREE|nr:uncharacterized protein I303_02542 [Kwoniella dejecticola CBS 10117]OBR86534.1 hypothetical protein I303_02542 [Kwoniella dejecticola CBS 10117]
MSTIQNADTAIATATGTDTKATGRTVESTTSEPTFDGSATCTNCVSAIEQSGTSQGIVQPIEGYGKYLRGCSHFPEWLRSQRDTEIQYGLNDRYTLHLKGSLSNPDYSQKVDFDHPKRKKYNNVVFETNESGYPTVTYDVVQKPGGEDQVRGVVELLLPEIPMRFGTFVATLETRKAD